MSIQGPHGEITVSIEGPRRETTVSIQGPHRDTTVSSQWITGVVLWLGLTERVKVLKVSQRPPRVESISRQSMP